MSVNRRVTTPVGSRLIIADDDDASGVGACRRDIVAARTTERQGRDDPGGRVSTPGNPHAIANVAQARGQAASFAGRLPEARPGVPRAAAGFRGAPPAPRTRAR